VSRMALLQQRVLHYAREWWVAHRSEGMTDRQHLADPTVGVYTQHCTDHEIRLARAVARLVECSWETDEAANLVKDLLACSKGLEANNWRTCDEVRDRVEIYRRAEVFLGKREVTDDCEPQKSRPRRFVRLLGRGGPY